MIRLIMMNGSKRVSESVTGCTLHDTILTVFIYDSLTQQTGDKSTHTLIDALGMMLRVDSNRSISYSTSPLRSNAAGDC